MALLSVFALGIITGQHQRHASTVAVPPEVRELGQNLSFSTKDMDEVDAILWAGLLNEAKLCDNCNALQESRSVTGYNSRPLTVSMRNENGVSYTMVVGTLAYSQGHRMVRPTVAYYVGYKGGLTRIDGTGKVEHRAFWVRLFLCVKKFSII